MFSLVILGSLFWLVPLAGLAALAICVYEIALVVRRPRNTVDAPSCSRCGYHVAGLTSFTCPECGIDLRGAGIVTRALEMRHRGNLFIAIVAWTVLMLGVGSVFGSILAMTVGLSMAMSGAVGRMNPITTTTSLTPASGAAHSILLDSIVDWSNSSEASSVVVTLTAEDGSEWRLAFAPAQQTFTIEGPEGVVGEADRPYTAESARALYDAAGLDSSDPDMANEARDLAKMIDTAAISPYASISAAPESSFTIVAATTNVAPAAAVPMPAPFFSPWNGVVLAALGVWVALYVIGLIYIVRRRRHLMSGVGRRRRPRAAIPRGQST